MLLPTQFYLLRIHLYSDRVILGTHGICIVSKFSRGQECEEHSGSFKYEWHSPVSCFYQVEIGFLELIRLKRISIRSKATFESNTLFSKRLWSRALVLLTFFLLH